MRTYKTYSFAILLLLGLLLVARIGADRAVNAQAVNADWSDPINLSQSGGASDPRLILDANGVGHLLWRDEFRGFVYRRGTGLSQNSLENWGTPTSPNFPFSAAPRAPNLIAGANGLLHAFWLNQGGQLFHSSVSASAFANAAAWSTAQLLAESAAAADATIAPDGRLHLVYIRSVESAGLPAGVYYRQSNNNGASWSGAAVLYSSPYLRAIASEAAQVRATAAAVGSTNYVYVSWNNPLRDQLFMTQSSNGGASWATARLVDSRRLGDGAQATSPSQPRLYAQGANALLTWQAGHGGRACDQQYQWTNDGGASWSTPQPMSEQLSGCPTGLQLRRGPDGLGLMLAQSGQSSLLIAWDGRRWSAPQTQPALNNFQDPATFRPVDFGCYQLALNSRAELFVVGCDQGRSQDIWLMARPLGGAANWFPPPVEETVWNQPVVLADLDRSLRDVTLVGDADGRFHAFWTKLEDRSVTYARWDGEQWSRPAPILTSPGRGQVGQPAIALAEPRLLAVWPDLDRGQLFFSWANSGRATAASEWAAPVRIPAPQPLVTAAAIAVDRAGVIYAAYLIPVNEERGIYLSRSSDDGASWSEPQLVFDGVAAGWLAVGPPRLAVDFAGRIHVSWTGQTLDGRPDGLYYALSDDNGASWRQPGGTAVPGEIGWQALTAVGDRIVHQLWAGQGGATASGAAALWHRHSSDGGGSWSRPARVAGLGLNPIGPAAIVVDPVGRLHAIQAASSQPAGSAGLMQLYYWLWQNERWQAEPPLEIGAAVHGGFAAPAAAAAQGDQLAFAFPLSLGEERADKLFFSARRLAPPETTPTPPPPLPPTATPTPPPTATPAPQPTATLFFPTEREPAAAINVSLPGGRVLPLAGLIPAVILVMVAFAFGARAVRKR